VSRGRNRLRLDYIIRVEPPFLVPFNVEKWDLCPSSVGILASTRQRKTTVQFLKPLMHISRQQMLLLLSIYAA